MLPRLRATVEKGAQDEFVVFDNQEYDSKMLPRVLATLRAPARQPRTPQVAPQKPMVPKAAARRLARGRAVPTASRPRRGQRSSRAPRQFRGALLLSRRRELQGTQPAGPRELGDRASQVGRPLARDEFGSGRKAERTLGECH